MPLQNELCCSENAECELHYYGEEGEVKVDHMSFRNGLPKLKQTSYLLSGMQVTNKHT